MSAPAEVDSGRGYSVTDIYFLPLVGFVGLLACLVYICIHGRYPGLFVGAIAACTVLFFAITWRGRGARVWLQNDGLVYQKFLGRKHFDKYEQVGILNKKQGAFTLVLQHGDVLVNRPAVVRELEPVLRSRVRARLT